MAQRVKPDTTATLSEADDYLVELDAPATQSNRINIAFLVLCVIGIGIASYLTWTHYTDTPILCTADHSCDTVNRSSYAYFPPTWGIPVSVLGLVGYLILTGLTIARLRSVSLTGRSSSRLDLALFIVTFGGVIFSAYLTAMEIWVINAICWWCVSSATIMTILFVTSVTRVWNNTNYTD